MTSITVRDSAGAPIAPGATATETVSCAPGEVAVGGGGVTANGNAVLTDSFSIQAAATAPPTGWEVDYRNDQALAAADTVFAEVICATP